MFMLMLGRNRQKVIIVLMISLIAIFTLSSCGGSKMETPDDIEGIISDSLSEIINSGESNETIPDILLQKCDYSIESTEAHKDNIDVNVHVSQRDAYSVLKEMEKDSAAIDYEGFLDKFNSKLETSKETETDVTVVIVKDGDDYRAEMDEATADVFLGGFLAYTEETMYNLMKDNE